MSLHAATLNRGVFAQVLVGLVLAVVAGMLWRWQLQGLPAPDPAPARLATAVILALLYLAFCAATVRRARSRAAALLDPRYGPASAATMLVAYASQTGQAHALARRSADSLHGAGLAVQLQSLGQIDAGRMRQCRQALFIVSTTGEGDAPDEAYAFVQRVLGQKLTLAGLRYGLLALGDHDYTQFCGFGRTLETWLRQQGATPLFDTVEVDDQDAGALRHWQHHLGVLSGHTETPDWSAPAYQRWRLAARRVLNPGSPGAPAVLVSLEAMDGAVKWEAGDIAEIHAGPPGSEHPHREYSIASLPADGCIELLVRQMRRDDGSPGLGSGWLTEQAPVGGCVELRIRSNAAFHAPDEMRPMILIGNGTGIAGLRAHLKARIAQGRTRNWLLFGERTRAQDFHFGAELQAWLASGGLARLDLAFSRDGGSARYVQDLIDPNAGMLCRWVADGAAIHVCGSLAGMAPAVDLALAAALGSTRMEALRLEHRYRRDVY